MPNFARQHPYWTAVIAAVVLLVAGGAFASGEDKSNATSTPAASAPVETVSDSSRAIELSEEGEQLAGELASETAKGAADPVYGCRQLDSWIARANRLKSIVDELHGLDGVDPDALSDLDGDVASMDSGFSAAKTACAQMGL